MNRSFLEKERRNLKDGDWYWIQKAVVSEYAKKIKSTGIAVYSFLASMANGNQSCFPSQKYIAEALGYSRTTINRAIKLLERNRLIEIKKRSRYHCVYYLLKVRCKEDLSSYTRCKTDETQMSTGRNSDVAQVDTNNNKLTRINNNNVYDDKNSFKRPPPDGFIPKTREELLALDLARGLHDHDSLFLYLSYAKKYPESVLRQLLSEVKAIPDNKIKKGRGALFNHLVKQYAKENL
ncbi:MAG: helix-turn-helix domain-containing protein [Candidatus Schekmanbacteria bacterium]|nr:helix-turn-helix domain-containing protein [Candidatus Schekmanbacteria bacterium]